MANFKLNKSESVEIMRIDPNGDMYWRGRLIQSDATFKAAMMDLHKHFIKTSDIPVHRIDEADYPPPDSGFAKL